MNQNISSDSQSSKKMGHKIEPSKTMGSTQSIHISEGKNHGYADLRRQMQPFHISIISLFFKLELRT